MKALHFFNPNKKTGKFFMILLLSQAEEDALNQAGEFDKATGTSGWIGESALQDSLKFPDRSAYVFRGYRELLDFIPDRLEERLNFEHDFKNFRDTPTLPELLAVKHSLEDAEKINLYVDHRLPLLDRHRRMLWGTYRSFSHQDYEKYLVVCRMLRPFIKIELEAPDIIVTRGYYKKGYKELQWYFNETEGFSPETNVLDAEEYPMLLLKSVL